MVNLKRASDELFRRTPDECFPSLVALSEHCHEQKTQATERWHLPQTLLPTSDMTLAIENDGEFALNDWSFSQLCRFSGVSKDTLNRLSSKTASRVLQETLPAADKPVQLLTTDAGIRSLHGVAYTRLWNADLLNVVREFATDFEPPQRGMNGATGLYCGEQDMFCFLIDPTGWTEIEGEAFAPGFFLWNSEVGRRSLGVQTFWFQAICQNHIVWDAVEVVEFTRKHTANVHDSLSDIRRIIETLVTRRDERRDGFVNVVRKAMQTKLGDDADEVMKRISQTGIRRTLVEKALEIARAKGGFTVFALVDALTQLNGKVLYAGDRAEADAKAARLLTLAV